MMDIGTAPIGPDELLLMMQTQLQQGGTQTWSNIPGAALGDLAFLSLWPDELHGKNPRGKQFVAIRPNRFPVWQSIITGAGTTLNGFGGDLTTPGFNTVVSCVCYNQLNADPEMMSAQAIAEDTIGMIRLILKVIRALQFWFPFDPNAGPLDIHGVPEGATYLREPCRMTDGGFGLNPRKLGDSWWSVGVVDFEMKFTAAFPS